MGMKKSKNRILTRHEIRSLAYLKRRKHHHIVHKIHKKHKISYGTLFYMKEYGRTSHTVSVIVRESVKMLILASVISSIGGMNLKAIESTIIYIVPLLILLPALNDMIGDFGTIVSSKFTMMLYMGLVGRKWWESKKVQELVFTIFIIAMISSVYIGSLSYLIATAKGFGFSAAIFMKVLFVSVIATALLVGLIIMLSIIGGIWIYRKKEDPNNFLIPITTSVADLGSLILFSVMVMALF